MADARDVGISEGEAEIRAAYARRQSVGRYSWFEPGYVFSMQSLEREMLALLARFHFANLEPLKILEIGRGAGHWLREFVKWGATPANVTGVDLLEDRVQEARIRCAPGVTVSAGNAAALDFPDGAFDIVLQSLVFTSVPVAEMRRRIAAEMLRVVKPNGLIVWHDFFVDNPRNRDVRGVRADEIRALFPGCHVALRRVGLAPPIFRAVGRRSLLLCTLLDRIPWLRTHYLCAVRPTTGTR